MGTPRLGSPAPGNSPRMAASGQGSPLRGMPSQGVFNSPQGSPSTSAAFSPGSLAAASESLASYSGSVSSPAQSSPERTYSSQISLQREAADGADREEEEGQQQDVRSLQVSQLLGCASAATSQMSSARAYSMHLPGLQALIHGVYMEFTAAIAT